jgi:hypothetical protein
MDPYTKTYLSLGLVFFALFELWAAMYLFGRETPGPHARIILRLHRIGGYLFLIYFVWISWVCIDMMDRLSQEGKMLDLRGVFHGFLAITLFGILLLKVGFVRLYCTYRPYVPLLGFVLVIGTLVLWSIAGLMFLIIM